MGNRNGDAKIEGNFRERRIVGKSILKKKDKLQSIYILRDVDLEKSLAF